MGGVAAAASLFVSSSNSIQIVRRHCCLGKSRGRSSGSSLDLRGIEKISYRLQLFVFFGQEVVNFIVPAIHFLIAQLNTLFDFSLGSVFFVAVLDDEKIDFS